MELLNFLNYGFVTRGLIAGIIVGAVAPLIGIFLVLRRYSLIADTLAHISLAGIALGAITGINPIYSAFGVTVLASLGIEKLRSGKKIYGESALALFLSGSLALALVLFSAARKFNLNILNYLFGSIITVTAKDIYIIGSFGIIVSTAIFLFYKELVYTTFDEEAARVSGIPTNFINTLLILLAALTVSLSIPIVGVLLIAALIVIPVITALQFHASLKTTLLLAEIFSLLSVILGITASFYLNLSTSGTIVLIALIFFILSLLVKKR